MKSYKYILLILIIQFIASYSICNSESITLKSIDISKYPTISTTLFFLDSVGNLINNIDKSEIIVDENGIDCDITSISCPSETTPKQISSILTIDISGSMGGDRILLAKSAATTWVKNMHLNISQCCITTFDDWAYVNQDWTNDQNKLLNAIANLKTGTGGTNYDSAFNNSKVGNLTFAKSALYKPVIIFLTDGTSSCDSFAIIQKAKQLNTTIYTIVLGMSAPSVLKKISDSTGGSCYDNITTSEEISNIYSIILQEAQEVMPCTIQWKSHSCSNSRNTIITVPKLFVSAKVSYNIQDSLLPYFEFKPADYLKFTDVIPNTNVSQQIVVIAKNDSIGVQSITSSNSSFYISNYGGTSPEFILAPNESRTLTVVFAPQDSSLTYARFDINSNACKSNKFFATGGYASSSKNDTTIKISYPNGGEKFIVGNTIDIDWDGVLPSDTVRLDVSTDNGITWHPITQKATGLSYSWEIPDYESNYCLMRVKQVVERDTNDPTLIGQFPASVRAISYNSNGTKIAVGGEYDTIYIYDISTKKIINKIFCGLSMVYSIAWHKNDTLLAFAGLGSNIKIWNLKTNTLYKTFIGHTGNIINSIAWNNSGNRLASGCSDKTIKIWDTATAKDIITLKGHNKSVTAIRWFNSDTKIVSGSLDSTAIIWNISDSSKIYTYKGHKGEIYSLDIDPNSLYIASAGSDSVIRVWSCTIGNYGSLIHNFSGYKDVINSLAWSPNSKYIASGCGSQDNTIKIWNTLNYSLTSSFSGQNNISSIQWESNSNYLASGSYDQSVRRWSLSGDYNNLFIQQDVSNSVWSIIKPSLVSKDVNLGKAIIDKEKDSVISNYLINNYSVAVVVDSIKFVGPNSDCFSLMSPTFPLIINANSSIAVEFKFKSSLAVIRTSNVVIYTPNQIITKTITCDCIECDLEVLAPTYIDFGKVNLGKTQSFIGQIIRNSNLSAFKFSEVENVGPDTTQFKIFHPQKNDIIPADTEIYLHAEFTPLQKGIFTTKLNLFYNGNCSPIEIYLIGEGVTPEISTVNEVNYHPLICSESYIDTSIIVTNVGNSVLTIDSATILNNSSNEFHFLESINNILIQSAKSDTFHLRFTPQTLVYGVRSCTITLYSNSINADNRSTYIPISASYYNLDYKIIPDSIDFGSPEIKQVCSKTITIKNNGSYPLAWLTPIAINSEYTITSISPKTTAPNGGISTATVTLIGDTIHKSIVKYEFVDECHSSKTLTLIANIQPVNKAYLDVAGSFQFPELICETTLTKQLTVKNIGATDLHLLSTAFSGADYNDYKVLTNLDNFIISPNSSTFIDIQFIPSKTGQESATLSIKSNAINAIDSIITISFSADKELISYTISADTLDFSSLLENTTKTATITINNIGTYPLTWKDVPDTLGNFIIESIEPIITQPNSSSDVIITFLGGTIGDKFNEIYSFTDTCGNSKNVELIANISQTASVVMQVGLMSGSPGDIIELPIILIDSQNLGQSGINYFTAELRTEPSILVPADESNKGKIVDGVRILPITIPVTTIEDNILTKIKFKATLGEKDTTIVYLSNLQPDKGSITSVLYPGRFVLTGLCTIGGKRLYFPGNDLAIYQVAPNPAHNISTISFGLNETGQTEISVYNMYGSKVAVLINKPMEKGKYDILFNTEEFPSGVYIINLKTYSDNISKIISIVK